MCCPRAPVLFHSDHLKKSRRPPHGRRCLHSPGLRLRGSAGLRHGPRAVRVCLRAPGRGAQPRRGRPVEPPLQRHRARPQARAHRRPQLRDDPPLPAVLCPGRPHHAARRLPPWLQRPPPRRERLQGPGHRRPHGHQQGRGKGGRGTEHQGDLERLEEWLAFETKVLIHDGTNGNRAKLDNVPVKFKHWIIVIRQTMFRSPNNVSSVEIITMVRKAIGDTR